MQTPLPIVSGRYFFPNAPVLCLKWMPACAVTSVNWIGPKGGAGDFCGAAAGAAGGVALMGADVSGCADVSRCGGTAGCGALTDVCLHAASPIRATSSKERLRRVSIICQLFLTYSRATTVEPQSVR